MRILVAILLAAFAVSCNLAYAQGYRWVDQDGKVRYGDVPPPGVKATRLKQPAAGAAPAAPASAAQKDGGAKALSPEAAFRKRQEDAEKERVKEAKAEQEKAE